MIRVAEPAVCCLDGHVQLRIAGDAVASEDGKIAGTTRAIAECGFSYERSKSC